MKIDGSMLEEGLHLSKVDKEEEINIRIDKIKKQLDNLVSFIADGILVLETKEKIKKLMKEREQAEEILTKIKKEKKS